MTPDSAGPPASARPAGRLWTAAILVLLAFLAYSSLCRPVPSVNEPHYLTKARHYWQPQWCEGDFFLDSSNPHRVFYQTIGALTQWLTLEQSAWLGRLIALTLLAWGWCRLIGRLSPRRGVVIGSACLFLFLQSLGNFSGEWLVGGVESKVLAYALAFAGWGNLLGGSVVTAGLLLGLAISFHPVVGLWCVIATGMALVWQWFDSHTVDGATTTPSSGRWLAGGLLLAACALPGLIPALQTQLGADPQAAALADRYQVGVRLPHHLDPMAFPLSAYRHYGLLLLIWLLIRRPEQNSPARRLFVRIVVASLVIAGVGIAVGWGPRPLQQMPLSGLRVWMLKFYPFRLADLLLPILLSVTLYERIADRGEPSPGGWRRYRTALVSAAALGLALWIPGIDKSSSRMTPAQESDWIAACEWIRTQTPEDSLLYAANEDWAVKWFTHRSEYVNYKDCPQDADGILEWVRRLKFLNRWHRAAFRDGRITAEELQQLYDETGITHLLVSRLGPIDTEPVYRNDSFRVYAVTAPQAGE